MGSPELPEGKLEIELIKGEDTKASEYDRLRRLGKADPYCIVKLGELEYTSKICKNGGSKPVWNEKTTFVLKTSDRKYSELTISLFNENSFRVDTPLGESRIDLASLVANKGNSIPADRYPVFVREKNSAEKHFGWIHVGFNFTPDFIASKEDDASQDAAFGNSSEASRGTYTAEHPDKLNSTKDEDEASSNSSKVDDNPQGNVIPQKGDSANDEASDDSSAANGGGESKSGKEEYEDGAGNVEKSKSGEEEHEDSAGNAEGKSESRKGEHEGSAGNGGGKSELGNEEHEDGAGNGGEKSELGNEEHEDGAGNGGEESELGNEEHEDGAGSGGGNSKSELGNEEDEDGAENGGTKSESRKEHEGSAANGEVKPDLGNKEQEDGAANGGVKPDLGNEQHEDGAGKSKPGNEEREDSAANGGTSTPNDSAQSKDNTLQLSTHHQDGDNAGSKGIEKEPAKFGGLRSAASSIWEASINLGRNFSYKYAAVPTLVIACLVFAAVKRPGRDIQASGGNSDGDAALFRTGAWQGQNSGEMPTSTRQKIRFFKIYGTN